MKDKIKNYCDTISSLLNYYLTGLNKIENNLLHDEKKMCYQIHESGWENGTAYYFNILLHLQIKTDGKVWIYENRTELDIAFLLSENGVSKSDIVLNFIPFKLRSYTGYAIS